MSTEHTPRHDLNPGTSDLQRQVTGAMVEAATDALADGLGVPRSDWHAPQRREAVRAGLISALAAQASSSEGQPHPRQVTSGDVIGVVRSEQQLSLPMRRWQQDAIAGRLDCSADDLQSPTAHCRPGAASAQTEHPQVSRVEVIDSSGRAYTAYDAANVCTEIQDEATTLKVFLDTADRSA